MRRFLCSFETPLIPPSETMHSMENTKDVEVLMLPEMFV